MNPSSPIVTIIITAFHVGKSPRTPQDKPAKFASVKRAKKLARRLERHEAEVALSPRFGAAHTVERIEELMSPKIAQMAKTWRKENPRRRPIRAKSFAGYGYVREQKPRRASAQAAFETEEEAAESVADAARRPGLADRPQCSGAPQASSKTNAPSLSH